MKCVECSTELNKVQTWSRGKFCSRNCAALYNNRRRPKHSHPCPNCEALVSKKSVKYCDPCGKARIYSKIYKLELAGCDAVRKRILLETRGWRCEKCRLTNWLERPITLEMDHVDGNPDNSSPENLKILCLNCHAQTPTYRSKNRGVNSRRHLKRRSHYKRSTPE